MTRCRGLLDKIGKPQSQPGGLFVALRTGQARESREIEEPNRGRMDDPASPDTRVLHHSFDVLHDIGVDHRLKVATKEPAGEAACRGERPAAATLRRPS